MKAQFTEVLEVSGTRHGVEFKFVPKGGEENRDTYTVRITPHDNRLHVSVSGLGAGERNQRLAVGEVFANQLEIKFVPFEQTPSTK